VKALVARWSAAVAVLQQDMPVGTRCGLDANGQPNAGLLFISYQKDPRDFIRLQNRLGAHDLLDDYIRHIGSAVFAIPPAPEKGHYIGQSLFS
jgi:deferrochelatase/peroxidase EfeB